jgi:GAF domain-containing protein
MTTDRSLLSHYLGIAPSTREEGVLRLLLETAIRTVDAAEGSVLAYDPDANDLRFVMVVNGPGSLVGQRVPIGAGLTGLAALTHEVQIGAPTFKTVDDANKATGVEGEPSAVIAAPMVSGDTLIGVLTAVRFKSGHRFTTDDGRAYGNFATIAALMLDQHNRLRSMTGDRGGELTTAGGYGPEEARILNALGTVARTRPDRLPRLAQLFEQMVDIAS